MAKASCPMCDRAFNCTGDADCWCLKVEDRKFDYMEMIIEMGSASCVCPVCLTGKESAKGLDGADA